MENSIKGILLSDSCYLRETCWKFNNKPDAECRTQNVFCPRFFRMNYLYEESLMSIKQRQHVSLRIDEDGTDLEAFNKLKNIEEHIDQFVSGGNNLYLHSTTCGNGKTAWALRMLQSYIGKIWYKSDLKCKVLFINVPRYILALKDSISASNDYIDHIKKYIFDADLVVVDTEKQWTVCGEEFASKGKFTPLEGKKLTGQVIATFLNGKIVFQA